MLPPLYGAIFSQHENLKLEDNKLQKSEVLSKHVESLFITMPDGNDNTSSMFSLVRELPTQDSI
jgi:hypothetical protein